MGIKPRITDFLRVLRRVQQALGDAKTEIEERVGEGLSFRVL